MVALSLRTRDPEQARTLGSGLNGLANRAREQLRKGIISFEEVRQHLTEAGPGKRLFCEASVTSRALEVEAERKAQPPAKPYTLDQECAMLAAFGRRVVDILDGRATDLRLHYILCFAEGPVDWISEAMRSDLIQAEVCRLLGFMRTSAKVRPEQREQLKGKGLSEGEVDIMDVIARRHAEVEDGRDWLIGPTRDVLLHHLDAAGIAPTEHPVRRFRASALWIVADLLEMTFDRYVVVPKHVNEIAVKVLSERPVKDEVRQADHRTQPVIAVRELRASRYSDSPTLQAEQDGQGSPVPSTDTRRPASFIALVTKLMQSKCNSRLRTWTDKTARQHLSIARLFVKCAGTDDPGAMTQANVGAYLSLLSSLPTHWGKSLVDADRSLDDILARTEDLEEEEIGLSAPTINRHRIQLSTILAHMAMNGYAIGLVNKASRAKDPQSPEQKRRAFTADEGRNLIAGTPWTGIAGPAAKSECGDPPTGAQFWVFPINWYMLLRLGETCGLMVDDIDHTNQTINIRNNALRRVKNARAQREIPIPEELIRLGLLTFARHQKKFGHVALFPELYGSATAPTVLFNKKWVKVLDNALPEARSQRKTMHSTRKGGNSAMMEVEIMDHVRYYILGHTLKDVHGRHYTRPPTKQQMIEALSHIPNVTSVLRLKPSEMGRSVSPSSEATVRVHSKSAAEELQNALWLPRQGASGSVKD